MPRPARLEFSNALYHVTSRGVHKGPIFHDDDDRALLLAIAAQALRACDAQVFAYCLMGNHYHFVLQTRRPNLSSLMHRVNSVYSLTYNRRHGLCGPVFESRFRASHVDRDSYLLQACRYVDLNPVRAGLVQSAMQWAWSSFRSHTGLRPSPPWLATAELHGVLMGRIPEDVAQTVAAQRHYADWVEAGRGVQLWKEALRARRFLGDEAFVESVLKLGR